MFPGRWGERRGVNVIVLKMILTGLRISHSEPMSTRTDPEQIMNKVSVLRGKKIHYTIYVILDPTTIRLLTWLLSSFYSCERRDTCQQLGPETVSAETTHPPVSGSPSPCAAAGSAGGWQSSTGPDSRPRSSWAAPPPTAGVPRGPETSCRPEERAARAPGRESGLKHNSRRNTANLGNNGATHSFSGH